LLGLAEERFSNQFFNPDTYDLSVVGRFKMNAKLGVDTDINHCTLTREDIMMGVKGTLPKVQATI